MSDTAPISPLQNLLSWMSAYTQFPRSRLPERAELMLLISACVATEEASAAATRNPLQRRDNAKESALRAHAMRRSMVHYRCDKSAKV